MKRLHIVGFILLIAPCLLYAQGAVPTFDQYKATVERPRVKRIDFKKNPEARMFRTRLTEGLLRGVNFAGLYVVVGWGCGTGCLSGAIIDARSGMVYWPEEFNSLSVGYDDGDYESEPVEYKKNSRLLIIRGTPGQAADDAPEKPAGVYYYEWKANRLRQIAFVPYHKD